MTKDTTGEVDVAATETSTSFTGLFPGELYRVAVQAVSDAEFSTEVTKTTTTGTSILSACVFKLHPSARCWDGSLTIDAYVFTVAFPLFSQLI